LLDKKQAYEAFGLDENASLDEMEKKYDLLIRKYRSETSNKNQEITIDIEKINEAYKSLHRLNYEANEEQANTRSAKFLRKICRLLKIDNKKAENALHYYTKPAIAIIVGLAVLTTVVVTMITNVNADLNVVYVGDYSGTRTDEYVEKIQKAMPELKKAEVRVVGFNANKKMANQHNEYIKIVAMLTAGDIDILILDSAMFDDFVKQNILSDLKWLESGKTNSDIIEAELKKFDFYAIDVTKSKFLTDDKIKGKTKIAAIPKKCSNLQNAKEFVKIIVN